ncbi:MAG TPA: hypothetical protein VHO90_06630 [Bacteroidales bacterium]|nr:hypothetical protein [Bacteroidales bacterium]
MKQSLLIIILFVLTHFLSYSQIKKGDILFDLNGSYVESTSGSGVSVSNYWSKNKSLNTFFSVGYSISNSFVAGVGVGYTHLKENRNYTFLYSNNFMLAEQMKIKSSIVSPLIYFKYYKLMFGKLLFSANLSSSFGFIDLDTESVSAGRTSLIQNTNLSPFNDSYTEKNKSNNLVVSLEPEFSYFLTERWGVLMKIGGIKYYSYDFEDHDWTISFNPNKWEYGVFLKLGKK